MVVKGIRQVAVMVDDLDSSVDLYRRVLGMEVCATHDLGQYGLRNAVLPAGEGTFVEVLQPTDPQSAGARYLQRRGEGMYLLIFETDDLVGLRSHFGQQDIQVTGQAQWPGHDSIFVHPKSLNGVFMEFIQPPDGPNPWVPAGDTWHTLDRNPITQQIRQVAVLVRDLDTAIPNWEVAMGSRFTQRFPISFTDLEIAVMPLGDGRTFIELAQPTNQNGSAARYLERHGEGLYLLIFQVGDVARAEAHLRERDVQITTAQEAFSRASQSLPTDGIKSVWIHPRSMRGVFTQLSEVLSQDLDWPPGVDQGQQRG